MEDNIIRETITHINSTAPTIFFLKGLPASGKTTWAMEHLDASTIRLNKDDFRSILINGYSDKKETVIRAGLRAAGMQALRSGLNVIDDNINFPIKYQNFWSNFAKKHNFNMEVLFFNASLDECLDRDSKRKNCVGVDIITHFYKKYIATDELNSVVEYRKQNDKLLESIIVDIDGTLSFMHDRSPYDDTKIFSDVPNYPVVELIQKLSPLYNILIVTGREDSDVCHKATKEWLDKILDIPYTLYMRGIGDYRKDSIVKAEIFHNFIEENFYVKFVLDDRDSTVNLWRNTLKLPCFQVNYGNF